VHLTRLGYSRFASRCSFQGRLLWRLIDRHGITPKYAAMLLPAYRDLLTHYSEELAATAGELELLANLEDAIELNREMRRLWPQSDYRKRPIADSYFLIGQDGGGDLYAIDLALGDSTPVLEFDHERAKWRPRAASLSDFVKQIRG
jgi:hypothetical protein